LKPPERNRTHGRPRCRWRKMFNEMINEWLWSKGGIILTGENWSTGRKSHSNVTLSITNVMWSKMGLRSDKRGIDRKLKRNVNECVQNSVPIYLLYVCQQTLECLTSSLYEKRKWTDSRYVKQEVNR
jgi:hypothetical protein